MDEYDEDNDDESWSLPFCGDETQQTDDKACTDIRRPDSRVNTQTYKEHKQPLQFNSGIQQKYIIVTCNYVARERGVGKLMAVKEALERCPDLVLVNGEDLTHYRQVSYKVSEFLQQYTPHVERLGMDENFLDVTHLVKQRLETDGNRSEVVGHEYTSEHDDNNKQCDKAPSICICGCRDRLTVGSQISADIRDALYQELNITCCAGISYNKLLSKLVAGTHKPNQQTTLFPKQTAQFMSTVGQARRIPGIGSTTSKKLASLGIVSIHDLQKFDLSDLKQELGHKQAVTIKQLSFGVDDSTVVTFGRPQTLSDEDSFKKCSTVRDTRSKVRELLASLTRRLIEDGRRPQTLRLTIRKLTTNDKKWTNRESRQCPIPGHVMSHSSDKLDKLIDQLEEMAITLFTKLVNTKEPFHLTLINIAFCSLIEKSKNDISSFFSPKSDGDSSCSVKSHRNQLESACSPGNSQTGQMSVKMSKNTKPQNMLQKWVFKSPEKSGNIKTQQTPTDMCEERSTKVSRSSQVSEIKVNGDGMRNDSKNLGEMFEHIDNSSGQLQLLSCLKRKADKQTDDTGPQSKKRGLGKEITGSGSVTNPVGGDLYPSGKGTNKSQIPSDVDPDIFLQLPKDIQREVLREAELRKDYMCLRQNEKYIDVNKMDPNMDCKSSSTDSSNDALNSCSRCHFRGGKYISQQEGKGQPKETDTPSESSAVQKHPVSPLILNNRNFRGETDDFVNKQDDDDLIPSDLSPKYDDCIESKYLPAPENVTEIVSAQRTLTEQSCITSNITKSNAAGFRSSILREQLSFATDGCSTNESSGSLSYQLPPHIDKDVFLKLPADIQKEYINQWSRDSPLSTVQGRQSSNTSLRPTQGRQSMTSPTTLRGRQIMTKQKSDTGKASILNFFQTKNKKKD
ncbi:DNA polymerase iota-like isoform X2 [Argopecten irradians]|uniref:DNA polymerase iota-like isoform X2 n=1 Tax=Argopecten irradians TaxID=31199 RepID=UPI00371E7A10